MSKHAAERGTKRTCRGCGARFYDLNRDPITCPMCSAVFELEAPPVGRAEAAAAALAAEKARAKAAKKPEIVADDALPETPNLPEEVVAEDLAVEGEEVARVEGEEETFLPEEEEDTDVTGFIDAGIEEGGEEES